MRQTLRCLLCLCALVVFGPAVGQTNHARVAPDALTAEIDNAQIEPGSNAVGMFNGAARASGLSDWTLDLVENVSGDAVHLRYSNPNGPEFCEATIGRLAARDQTEANAAVHYLVESMSQAVNVQRLTWRPRQTAEVATFFHAGVFPNGQQVFFYSSIEARYVFPQDIGREAVVANKFCATPTRYVVPPSEFVRFQVSLSEPAP